MKQAGLWKLIQAASKKLFRNNIEEHQIVTLSLSKGNFVL